MLPKWMNIAITMIPLFLQLFHHHMKMRGSNKKCSSVMTVNLPAGASIKTMNAILFNVDACDKATSANIHDKDYNSSLLSIIVSLQVQKREARKNPHLT